MKRLNLFFVALLLLPTISFAQSNANNRTHNDTLSDALTRVQEIMGLIDQRYVDDPDMKKMSETAVVAMLKALDPHSVYIAAKDVERANEGLQGNFEGVGISFQLVDDTIIVSSVISGGPCEKVGVRLGDKIISINDTAATGDSINNNFVFKHLRGKKGTLARLKIKRGNDILTFDVVRDKVPIYSIDAHFMVDDSIGYIRLTRFARTSIDEFRSAMNDLHRKGMKALILDLRGNSGGFLDIACGLANEFLERGQLIVYTQGRNVKRQNTNANGLGKFRRGTLVVLIDEGSASASEIVSGAVQDWDRGTIIGRRSFGKGLVQRMFPLHDGGQVRLTTARYYTPSGRCIQRPYDKGIDAYNGDIAGRYKRGEMVSADSIHLPDSLKYHTHSGRVVYGGGGIMPDLFVPMDTMRLSEYYISLRNKGLINTFAMQWANANRKNKTVKDYNTFLKNYDKLNIYQEFEKYATEKGVVRDVEKEKSEMARTEHSDRYLAMMLKALVAHDLFGMEYYYLIMKDIDEPYLRAVEYLQKGK